ncbi:MAG: glycosyltransferase [Aristaeellaceae bacterium]
MIRVLQVVSVMDMGGMENYIMNLYRHMDRSRIQFDFLVHHARRGYFEDEIEALGGHVYHTSLMDDFHLPRYLRALDEVFARGEYRIVHGHLGSTAYLYLGAAARHGVAHRILHSHCPGHPNTLKGYVKHILFHFSPIHATIRLACSGPAGEYQFRRQPFETVPNGIDVDRFRFCAQGRDQARRTLGLEGRFVVGHVGRFCPEKNHGYLLRVFRLVKDQCPEAALLLLGDGALMARTRAQARALGLEADVRFMGVVGDCAPCYQAMDVFVMPSLYEALPLTGIEAQCAGLPCLFSDTVSAETSLGDGAEFLPIGPDSEQAWAQRLLQLRAEGPGRRELPEAAMRFDARAGALRMAARYEALWGNDV